MVTDADKLKRIGCRVRHLPTARWRSVAPSQGARDTLACCEILVERRIRAVTVASLTAQSVVPTDRAPASRNAPAMLSDGALVKVATIGSERARNRRVPRRPLGGGPHFAECRMDRPVDARPPAPQRERKAGPFHDVLALYGQANLPQIMQGAACNALHAVKQRTRLENASCECYEVVRAHFQRLGL